MGRARAATVIAACAVLAPSGAAAAVPGFERDRLDIFDFHLFDLGVVDYDDDGDLDLYTVNHLERQSLLRNDGAGSFSERLYPAGLAQTRAFPGWEDRKGPKVDGPGLYLSAGGKLVLRHRGSGRARGSAEFMFPIRVKSKGNAGARVRRDRDRNPDRWVASFTMKGNSRLALDPERMAHPMVVHVRRPLPLSRIFVGALERHPSTRRFRLYLRDRHGMAWADHTGDRRTDVFIVRGGLRGSIRHLAGAIRDELLDGRRSRFRPARAASSLRKGTCRARAAGAVNLDSDARLDLFATCKGRSPALYRRRGDGRFAKLGTGALDADVLRFADLDGHRRPEALGVHDGRFSVFEGGGSHWHRVQTLGGRHGPRKDTGLAMGDPDGDGDQDVYVANPTGSTMLINLGGRLRARNPRRYGLPPRALAASWVDYDNDGRLDLHATPGGLFRKRAGFKFNRVGGLATVEDPAEARIAWADLDNDGDRDLVTAARRRISTNRFKTFVHWAPDPANHWLQLDLRGQRANAQAVGARVRVRAGGDVQTQWVGQNETSLYSQGHYRLYFGLGDADKARVAVRWPDGRKRSYGPFAADQLVTLRR